MKIRIKIMLSSFVIFLLLIILALVRNVEFNSIETRVESSKNNNEQAFFKQEEKSEKNLVSKTDSKLNSHSDRQKDLINKDESEMKIVFNSEDILRLSELDAFKNEDIWYLNYKSLGKRFGVFELSDEFLILDNGTANIIMPKMSTTGPIYLCHPVGSDNKIAIDIGGKLIERDNKVYIPILGVLDAINEVTSTENGTVQISYASSPEDLYKNNIFVKFEEQIEFSNDLDSNFNRVLSEISTLEPKATIDIEITTESMAQGYVMVTYTAPVKSNSEVKLQVGNDFYDIAELIEPFNNQGDFTFDGTMHVNYKFNETTTASFGYKYKPVAGRLNIGYIDSDIGWLPVSSLLGMEILNESEVTLLNIHVPDGLPYYMPMKKTDGQYILALDRQAKLSMRSIQKGGVIAFGDFDLIESYNTDSHSLNVLIRGNVVSDTVNLSSKIYKEYMDILGEDASKFLPDVMNMIYLSKDYHTRGEGMTGVQVEVLTNQHSIPKDISSVNPPVGLIHEAGSFQTTNHDLKEVCRYAIHQITHAVYSYLPYWWMLEGYADYEMYDNLNHLQVDRKVYEDEFADMYLYYKREIVDRGLDIPMVITGMSIREAEALYDITRHKDEGDFLELGVQFFSNSNYNFAYTKGALISYTINKIIETYAPGYSVDDYYKSVALAYNSANGSINDHRTATVKSLNNIVGFDTTSFFDQHVYSNEGLPLEYKDGVLKLTWVKGE